MVLSADTWCECSCCVMVSRVFRWIAIVSFCLCVPSCGTDFDPMKLGEPCTRDNQCEEPLRCLGGVCSDADAGA